MAVNGWKRMERAGNILNFCEWLPQQLSSSSERKQYQQLSILAEVEQIQHLRNLIAQQLRNLIAQQLRNLIAQQLRNLIAQQLRSLIAQQLRSLIAQQLRSSAFMKTAT